MCKWHLFGDLPVCGVRREGVAGFIRRRSRVYVVIMIGRMLHVAISNVLHYTEGFFYGVSSETFWSYRLWCMAETRMIRFYVKEWATWSNLFVADVAAELLNPTILRSQENVALECPKLWNESFDAVI